MGGGFRAAFGRGEPWPAALPSHIRPGGSRSRSGPGDGSREESSEDRRATLTGSKAGCRPRRGWEASAAKVLLCRVVLTLLPGPIFVDKDGRSWL